jgi:ATP synthase protein I
LLESVPSFVSKFSVLRYPLRRVIAWQACASVLIAAVAAVWAGAHGALSALLGGVVNATAAVVFAFVGRMGDISSPVVALRTMIRAEAAKIAVIVFQLWLVLTTYGDVVQAALFSAFAVTVLVAQAAILIRD